MKLNKNSNNEYRFLRITNSIGSKIQGYYKSKNTITYAIDTQARGLVVYLYGNTKSFII